MPVKENATNWCYSVALTHLTARQIMLEPNHNGTASPERLWRMTGGSQIGNCIKSVGTSNRQNGRPNVEIMITSVTKNDMGSVKCSFRRACAVEWFGQISRLGSSVASIWYMATDFGRRFVTWAHYTTWAQSRDFRGRKSENFSFFVSLKFSRSVAWTFWSYRKIALSLENIPDVCKIYLECLETIFRRIFKNHIFSKNLFFWHWK